MISKFFIDRPIVAMVISIIMVIVGAIAMINLPTAQFPDIVPPEVVVQANYPGADAQTLLESVATPIESQMNGVDNMNYMLSMNDSAGFTQVTVNFDVKTEPDTDQILTQLRVSQASAQLPPLVNTAGITVQKSLSSPLMVFALVSPNKTYDQNFLSNYAFINMVDELSRVAGVGRVQVFAGQYAMRIWVRPDKLAKLGVTVPQITAALGAQNTINPSGQIGGEPVPSGQQFTYTVRSQGRLTSPEEFGNIVIRANPDGSTLRLKDVARIELGAQYYNFNTYFNGQDSAIVAVYQLPGSNALSASQAVKNKLEELKTRFPNGVDYRIGMDTTRAVSAGIHEIVVTLFISLVLVILVVYLFLQGWRATLIPLLAVPVSLIGTFVIFPLLGFSINTLSLFGLVLAIGLVVDDAIVVVEAVSHHIEEGMSPRDATIRAMEEVSGPVIAIALILAAVFIPTAFIPGITGRLYQQFAATIAISVVISAFNALTLSPALCAMLLRHHTPNRGSLSRFFEWFNGVFARSTNTYINYSGFLIRKSSFAVISLVLFALAAVAIGGKLPNSFLPEEDQGYVMVDLILPPASSLQRTTDAAHKVEKILQETKGVANVTTLIGYDVLVGTSSTHNAIFFIDLKDWDERRTAEERAAAIQNEISMKLSQFSDGISFAFSPPAIPGVGTAGGVNFVLEDRSGKGVEFFAQNLNKFVQAASQRPELASVNTTFNPDSPQIFVDVDREKVLRQRVDISQVYQTMQAFMGGYLTNYFNRFGRQWQVYIQAEGDSRTDPANIRKFYVTNSSGNMVPLSAIANVRSTSGPEFLMRYNEYMAAQLNVTANPGYSSGQARKALEEVFAQTMPSQMGFDYMGMSYQEQKAEKGVSSSAVVALSLGFVFLILAALYESWSLPFSVLLSTPVAVFGGFLALWGRQLENNVYAQIGLVMLIGLSAKNAILIVEFAKLEYEKGKSAAEAALAGARLRLRPILMTSFAFILGCVPLWIATGSGAAGRQVLGTVVIGGMLAASMLAIFLVPVTFTIMERLSIRFSRHKKRHAEPVLAGERGGA
ncbi:MAG TPA: multidrug efflux RND transporter permease subunit [Candidatus Saccharimonadales bacterium]|nr:multidrug efflux RND transporter permease subunit [Candidatus Saccharimonadales bacterium]